MIKVAPATPITAEARLLRAMDELSKAWTMAEGNTPLQSTINDGKLGVQFSLFQMHPLQSFEQQSCKCGQDIVTCQVCGKPCCGNIATWKEPVRGKKFNGNVCPRCL